MPGASAARRGQQPPGKLLPAVRQLLWWGLVVLGRVAKGHAAGDTPIDTVMTPQPDTMPATATVLEALHQLQYGGYRHVPVVGDGGEPQVARSHSGRRERGHKEEKPHKKERGHKKKGAKEGAGGALSDTDHDGESRSISQSVTQSQSLTHNSLPTLVTHMPIA